MAAAVTLTRVAQLENRAVSARDFEKKGAKDERKRERSEAKRGTFACFRLSLYILLPTYTCLRVSPRCSGLDILAVRRAPLSSLSFSFFPPFSHFFSFSCTSSRASSANQTRNPLVASTRHPPNDPISPVSTDRIHPRVAVLSTGEDLARIWLRRKVTSLRLGFTIHDPRSTILRLCV